MPIETFTDQDRDLTIQTATGVVTAEEIEAAVERYYRDDRETRLLLWDLRDAEKLDVGGGDVRRLVSVTREYAERRPGGRTALVFTSDFGFGLGRMYETHQESGAASPIQHRSFRDYDQAMAWLLE